MSSATVLDEDNPAAKEVRIHKDPLMSSAQRRKLSDISNLEQMKTQKQQQQQAMLFSSKEYAEKLEKENMTLMKALAHRNKIIELSGVEIQKLRINLRNVQEKNLQLAQANSHMLAELNANRDSLKLLQHELCCKNVLLEARKRKTEEQGLPSTDNDSKDKVPSNVSDGHCEPFQAHDVNHKDTKRKRTSMIKPSESSVVKPIQGKENVNSKRRVSGVIDTTVIPEVTCQTEEDAEKGFVSQGTNQIADNIVSNKFVLDAANPVKDGVNSKRQCVRRKSTRFDVQATEQTETVLEMDVAKDTKETARISLKRRSARLRPEEAEPCKSFHERDELKETVKGRRVSSRKQSARFDLQETEVTGTLNADDAGKASGVIDTTVIPEITCQAEYDAEKGFDSQGTNQIVDNIDNIVNEKFVLDPANPIKGSVHSNRPCVRKKSTRVNVQVAEQTETVLKMDDAKETKETARLSLRRVSARLRPKEAEPCKSFHEIDEVEETIKTRRVSSKQQSARFDLQEPEVTGTLNAADAGSLVSDGSEAVEPSESRQDTKDTNGKCRVTTRRQSAKCISQTATETGGAIKDVVTDPSISINTVQESDVLPSTVSPEDLEKESKNKPEAEETGGMMRRASMRRASRHAAEKVQSYREVSLKVKLRREC
ncbi:Shugoshin C terminus [Raphanus sativus]|uniref:SHUGOSHIN 2 isoform X2 n=1 Tax=Raphanus sativus TaxID=3726 RepID=A0A6J0K4L1_RAPSA|nr:SHUGOSHIN 2 isoform X2 [Raphanus sativus]KAJ4882410.1 Shugoshin C terminus [Raphanus sativus]